MSLDHSQNQNAMHIFVDNEEDFSSFRFQLFAISRRKITKQKACVQRVQDLEHFSIFGSEQRKKTNKK